MRKWRRTTIVKKPKKTRKQINFDYHAKKKDELKKDDFKVYTLSSMKVFMIAGAHVGLHVFPAGAVS